MIHLRLILGAALVVLPIPAMAGPAAVMLTAITPANDGSPPAPVFEVSVTFSGPVALKSFSVTGPRGESSLEQVLLAYGEKIAVSDSYTIPLKTPVAAVGRYSIDMMTWEAQTRTSSSRSTSFAIGSPAELEVYDEELARFDEAERTRKAEEEASADAEAGAAQ